MSPEQNHFSWGTHSLLSFCFFWQKPKKKVIISEQSRKNLMITCRILFFWRGGWGRGGIPDLWSNIDLLKCKEDLFLKTLKLVLNFITVATLSMCLSGCRVRTIKCHSLYSYESAFCLLHLINIKRWNSVPIRVNRKTLIDFSRTRIFHKNLHHCHWGPTRWC